MGFRGIVNARLNEVLKERLRQQDKWGEQNHPDGTGRNGDVKSAEFAKQRTDHYAKRGILTYRDILEEEVREAYAETDQVLLRAELIQVAAVAVAWIEKIDRNTGDE